MKDGTFFINQCGKTKPSDFNKCKRQQINAASPPDVMKIIGKKRICGVTQDGDKYQKGPGFLGSIQANKKGECPEGTYLCGDNSQSAASKICINIDESDIPDKENILAQNCPITDVHISSKRSLDKAGYKYTVLFDDIQIGFSKKEDNLPMIRFKIEQKTPCFQMQEQSIVDVGQFQANEIGYFESDHNTQHVDGCSENKLTSKHHDPRFVNLQNGLPVLSLLDM